MIARKLSKSSEKCGPEIVNTLKSIQSQIVGINTSLASVHSKMKWLISAIYRYPSNILRLSWQTLTTRWLHFKQLSIPRTTKLLLLKVNMIK